jgi:hypothetical protein
MGIHEKARQLLYAREGEVGEEQKKRSRIVLGPLEQYVLLNLGVREEADIIKKRIEDFLVVFVTGVSTDILAVNPEKRLETGVLKASEIASPKMGFSFYSDNNAFSTQLLNLELLLNELIGKVDKKEFPDLKEKPRLYVVVGPFVAMGYLHKNGFKDLLSEDIFTGEDEVTNIAHSVDSVLLDKGKKPIGDMEKYTHPSFQNMYYRFSEAFFDGAKARRIVEQPRGMSFEDFERACTENTFYNRFIASYMYKSLLDMIDHQDEFLVIASETSYAMNIMGRALAMAGKKRVPLKVMRGTRVPLEGEANPTVMNNVGGYLQRIDLGKRKVLRMNDFFNNK